MDNNSGNTAFTELRRRARMFLEARPGNTVDFPADIGELVHELDTCRIELELQNEDLRNAQNELEKSRRRCADLYDFAPVAYLTISD